jgi:LysM repeat protein
MVLRIKIFFIGIVIQILVSGCVFDQMATKGDVTQVQGSLRKRQSILSEEVIALKRDVNSLKIEINDATYKTEGDLKQQKKVLNSVSFQLSQIKKDLSSLQRVVEGIRTEDIVILGKEISKSSAEIKKIRQQTEQKLNIILEEVNKENARLSKQIQSLQRRRSGIRRGTARRPSDGIHVVESGESLSIIAHRYGVSVEEMIEYNDLDDPDSIYVGQELKIPED